MEISSSTYPVDRKKDLPSRFPFLQIVFLGILLLSTSQHAFSQTQFPNLVPNADFNDFKFCPGGRGLIGWAEPWYSPNRTTTDYCHTCSGSPSYSGIPGNRWGYQEAYEGEGYAGLRTWISTEVFVNGRNYREYLAVPLLDSLRKGQRYFLSFQLSVGDSAAYYSDDIGMFLSRDSIPDDTLLPYEPQLRNPDGNILRNTEDWIEISGMYTAKGGERYLVIGNFNEDDNTTLEKWSDDEDLYQTTYYYIDHVQVIGCTGSFPDALIVSEDSALCPGESLDLMAVALDSAEYQWDNGSKDLVREIDSAQTYILEVSLNGCVETDSITIELAQVPELNLGPDTVICEGESLVIGITDSVDAYMWNNQATSPQISVSSAGKFELTIEAGNCSLSDEIEIAIETSPPDPALIEITKCTDNSVELEASIIGQQYIWQNLASGPVFEADQAGSYWVDIQSWCFDVRQEFVVSDINCGCEAEVPNVFTPNGDGINEEFVPRLEPGTSNYQLRIYDRWGKETFQSRDPNFLWRGNKGQNMLPAGMYYWVLEYTCLNRGEEVNQVRNGHVMLMR